MASLVPYAVKKEIVDAWLPATEAVWKVALYNNVAALALTSYTATNEITGIGYVAGGATLADRATGLVTTDDAYLNATDVTWTGATFTAQYAVVYRTSDLKVRFIYDFGGPKTVTTGTFTIIWDSVGLVKVS